MRGTFVWHAVMLRRRNWWIREVHGIGLYFGWFDVQIEQWPKAKKQRDPRHLTITTINRAIATPLAATNTTSEKPPVVFKNRE